MAKLYELTDQYRNIADLLDDPSMDKDTLNTALAVIEGDLQTKAANIAVILNSMDADVTILEREIKRLTERKAAVKNGYNHLRNYVQEQMEKIGLNEIKTPVFSLKIQKNPPKVEISSMDDLPRIFIQQTISYTVDKKAIAEAIKSGQEVPGATLSRGNSLRIR